MRGHNGYSIIELLVILGLMGLTSLAVIGIMNIVNNTLLSSSGKMNASTFSLETRKHLDRVSNVGISYCMDHPSTAGTGEKFHTKALGKMINDQGESIVKKIIDSASTQLNPGETPFSISLDNKILFTGNSVYGGTDTSKSSDYLTLLSSELHSFSIHKKIMAYQISSPRAIDALSTSSIGYLYVVSAVLENKLYRGAAPSRSTSLDISRLVSSKVKVSFVIRTVPANAKKYSIIDCGTKSLARTTAFAESCKTFGADFEYVVDHPTEAEPHGQCYMPQYVKLGSGPADGTKLGVVYSYVPIRAFFCEGVYSGKSFNMPFCTGSF